MERVHSKDSTKCQILKAEMSVVIQETSQRKVWLKYNKGKIRHK